MRKQNLKLGIFYGIISSISFAMMSVLVKKIGHQVPTSMLIFFRFITSLICLLPWLLTNPQFSLKIQHPIRYIIRILAALSALFCAFYAINFIPLIDVLLLNNTAPLFVPIIAWLITGAKTPKKASLGIVLGFIGIAIVLHPGKEIISKASFIALCAGVLSALAIVQIRQISKTSSISQMLFYYFAISSLLSGIVAAWQWQSPGQLSIWITILGIGLFGTLYQVFATLSYSIAPVRLMSSLLFLTVIFGGFFDWWIWGQVPTKEMIIGTILVIVGASVTVYFGQKEIRS